MNESHKESFPSTNNVGGYGGGSSSSSECKSKFVEQENLFINFLLCVERVCLVNA